MGVQATFVLPWAQTEIDGFAEAAVSQLDIGANWRALTNPLHIFGDLTRDILTNGDTTAHQAQRAARAVDRLLGLQKNHIIEPEALPRDAFLISDGQSRHIGRLILSDTGLLVSFSGSCPLVGQDYWVVASTIAPIAAQAAHAAGNGVICFATGTHLRTPFGSKPIEAFKSGDLVQTKDNGVKPVIWTGKRHMSGARLHVMPHLRPVLFRSGALGHGRPDKELIVSPQHRMLVKGAPARELFGSDELLVSARDLVDGKGVHLATELCDVTYHHLLLEQHQIVFANGLETESFHPALADIGTLSAEDQRHLLHLMPFIGKKPEFYGQQARRTLSSAQATILGHKLRA